MHHKLPVLFCAVCVLSGLLAEDSSDLSKYYDELKERAQKEISKPSHTDSLRVILDRYSAGEQPATVEVGNTAYAALLELFETPISDIVVGQTELLAQLQRHLFESERAIDLMLGIRVNQQIDDYVLYEWAAEALEGTDVEFTRLNRLFDINAFPTEKLVERLLESCCVQLRPRKKFVVSDDGVGFEEVEQVFSVEGLLSGEAKVEYERHSMDIYMAPTDDFGLMRFREDNAMDYLLVQSLFREQERRTQRFVLDIYQRYSELSEIDWSSQEWHRKLDSLLRPILEQEDPLYTLLIETNSREIFFVKTIEKAVLGYGVFPPDVMTYEAILEGKFSLKQDRRAFLHAKMMPFTNDSSLLWKLGALFAIPRVHGTVTPPLSLEATIPRVESSSTKQETTYSPRPTKQSTGIDEVALDSDESGNQNENGFLWRLLGLLFLAVVVIFAFRKYLKQLPRK